MDTPTRQGLEALLFLADEPVATTTLADALEVSPEEVEAACEQLAATYAQDARGMTVRYAAGGWRMYTAEAAWPVVERHVLAGRSGRLTQAALETLAVIAYKQPLSRQDVSDIRGVNADGAVRSLVARGFVEEVGRDDGPGQAVLYGTTRLFLERIGLEDLADLPELTDYLPEAPAPDEPALAALKAARKLLQSGSELPSTGAPRWTSADAATNTGPDQAPGDDQPALPPIEASVGGRRDDDEMDDLSERLERAARSAMDQLKTAVAATEADAADDEEEGDRGPADTAP
ncbi:MAG: SMC-Scp complex subunit ScpB [Actinomycetes bacterium]